MKYFSTIILGLIIILWSCSGSDYVVPEIDYSIYADRVYLDSIRLSRIPQVNNDGVLWDDDGTGPDVSLGFFDKGKQYHSNSIDDVLFEETYTFVFTELIKIDSSYLRSNNLTMHDFDAGPNPILSGSKWMGEVFVWFRVTDIDTRVVTNESILLPEDFMLIEYFIRSEFD